MNSVDWDFDVRKLKVLDFIVSRPFILISDVVIHFNFSHGQVEHILRFLKSEKFIVSRRAKLVYRKGRTNNVYCATRKGFLEVLK